MFKMLDYLPRRVHNAAVAGVEALPWLVALATVIALSSMLGLDK